MRRCIVIAAMLVVFFSLSVAVWPRQVAFAATTLDTSHNYKIVNKNSGLMLGTSGGSAAAGAAALQWTDNGVNDHLWHFIVSSGTNYNSFKRSACRQ